MRDSCCCVGCQRRPQQAQHAAAYPAPVCCTPWAEGWTPRTASFPCVQALCSASIPLICPPRPSVWTCSPRRLQQRRRRWYTYRCSSSLKSIISEGANSRHNTSPSGNNSTAVGWHHSLPLDSLSGCIALAALETCGAWMPISSHMQCSLHAIACCCTCILCSGTCQVAALPVWGPSWHCSSVSHVRWLHAGRAHVQALCPCANGPSAALLLKQSQGALMCVPLTNE